MAQDIKGSLTTKKNITAGGNVQVGNSGVVKLADADSTNFINLKAPSTVTSDVTLTFPATVGTNGYALTTDGTSGQLSWTNITSGSAPAGSGAELQYRVDGSTFGALATSAVSSSSLSIGTVTTTNAQLTVKSSSSTLTSLRLEAAASTADTLVQFGVYDNGGSLKAGIKADGSIVSQFLAYDVATRNFALTPQGAPTTRNLVSANTGLFTATNVATDFFNPSQNLIAMYNGSATYTTALGIGHEDGLGGAGVSISGAKIFAAASQASGTGSKSSVYGLEAFARVVSTGGATNLAAGVFEVKNTSTATVTNLFGLRILAPTNSGTVTNSTGLEINSFYLASSTSRAISSLGGEVYIATGNANAKGITIHGTASQSANLLTIEDSASSALFTFNSSGYASGQFLNSGLALRDSDSSHKLTITTGSNITADRSLTFNTGDASRVATFDGDTTLSGHNRVFRTQDSGAGIILQGNVIGTAETSLISSAVTIPANYFTVGKMIRVKIKGDFSTSGTAGTYTFRGKLGSTVISTSGAITMTNSLANIPFCLELDLNCWSTGATGGIDAIGQIFYNSSGTTPVCIGLPNSLATIATTASQNLDVTVQMSSGVSANVINIYTIEIVGVQA